MKIEKVMYLVMQELARAEEIHPNWPTDIVKAAAIVSEESGELLKSANDLDEDPAIGQSEMIMEAIHTAASALRFLKNLADD